MRAAGAWDKGMLLLALRDAADELGRTPKASDFGNGRYPCHETFYRHFGSFTAALLAAGFEPNLRKHLPLATPAEYQDRIRASAARIRGAA